MTVRARALGCDCDSCPLKKRTPVIPKQVENPTPSKIVLIAETPAEEEERQGQFLVGPTGTLLEDRILEPLGLRREEFHITNALLCWPKDKKLSPDEWKQAVTSCFPRLEREMEQVGPTTILTMGKWAYYATTGVGRALSNVVGTPVETFFGAEAIATYHPAMLFRDRWQYLPVIRMHVQRAWQHACGTLPEWDWGPECIEVSPLALQYLNAMRYDDTVAVDIETTGIDPFRSKITAMGLSSKSASVSIPWHSYGGVDGVVESADRLAIGIRKLVAQILQSPKHTKVFQNGIFDRTVMRALGIKCAPPYWDTLHAHLLISPGTEHGLDFQAATEFHAPRWKQTFRGSRKEMEK